MRRSSVAVACCLLGPPVITRAQALTPIPIDSAKHAFAEAHALCAADAGKLWGVSLCGPIMFVDAPTRQIVASDSDARKMLTAKEGAFVGVLPADQNVSNTAVEWSGIRWTQMLWPIMGDERARGTIVMHELFHRIQNQLDLPKVTEGDNAHLDELNGRYYLQLEWRALARALEAPGDADRVAAAKDALRFRAERYRLYPNAAVTERALEQNEGLAEYTGVRLGNPTAELQTKMALYDLTAHVHDGTSVRSFAYATGPAYGLLLDRYASGWHAQLKAGDGFDVMLGRALHLRAPVRDSALLSARARSYDGAPLYAAEADRDAKRKEQLAINRKRFIDGPVLTLPFRKMNVQFNPTTLQPLGDAGTVYPTIRIADEWGVIEGKNGALMKPDWSALVVPAPAQTAGSSVMGDGWTLTLKPGWKIVPDARSGDFTLAAPN
ncbi:MAG TPA: hypothetical protein VGO46_10190 [Gemmatimonadaceae bacterium]|nr:hypothetical protein [Gemmatimonadaceae bacterium]